MWGESRKLSLTTINGSLMIKPHKQNSGEDLHYSLG